MHLYHYHYFIYYIIVTVFDIVFLNFVVYCLLFIVYCFQCFTVGVYKKVIEIDADSNPINIVQEGGGGGRGGGAAGEVRRRTSTMLHGGLNSRWQVSTGRQTGMHGGRKEQHVFVIAHSSFSCTVAP